MRVSPPDLFPLRMGGKLVILQLESKDSIHKQSSQGNTHFSMYFSYMQNTLSFIQGFDCLEAWWLLEFEDELNQIYLSGF